MVARGDGWYGTVSNGGEYEPCDPEAEEGEENGIDGGAGEFGRNFDGAEEENSNENVDIIFHGYPLFGGKIRGAGGHGWGGRYILIEMCVLWIWSM